MGTGRLGSRQDQRRVPAVPIRLRVSRGAKRHHRGSVFMLTAFWHILRGRAKWLDLGVAHFARGDRAKTVHRLIRRFPQIGYGVQITPASIRRFDFR